MLFSVTSGRLPSVRPMASRPTRPGIDLRRREPVQMTVIPVHSLRHVPGDVVGVGVRHPRRDVQQHVVGISLRADVKSVGMEIQRRRGHLLRVDRDRLTLGRVLRTEVIPDGQAGEVVLEMDDQPFSPETPAASAPDRDCRPTSCRPTPCRGSPHSRTGGSSGPAWPPYRAMAWPCRAVSRTSRTPSLLASVTGSRNSARIAGSVLLSAVCAQAVAPGHASTTRTAPMVSHRTKRPVCGASPNENLSSKGEGGDCPRLNRRVPKIARASHIALRGAVLRNSSSCCE